MFSKEARRDVLYVVRKMLRDPTCEVEIRAGTKRTDKPGAQWIERTLHGGRTIVIKVRGGAVNYDQRGNLEPPHFRTQYDDEKV